MGNPFLTKQWQQTWYSHFGKGRKYVHIELEDEHFYLLQIYRSLPIYVNGGANFTNLIETRNAQMLVEQIKDKVKCGVVLLFDVPGNRCLSKILEAHNAQKVTLYPAFVSNLEPTFDEFFKKQFKSKKKRTELKKFQNRLKKLGSFEFVVINKEKDVSLVSGCLNDFLSTLKERYAGKRQYNRYLYGEGEKFFRDIVTNCVGRGLSLSMIKLDNIPISFAISYVYDKILIYSIPVFNIAFQKYNLGHIHLMCLIKWAVENGFQRFDFSKGESVYKKKWTNEKYYLFLYVLPLGGFLTTNILQRAVLCYFKLVKYMRDKGWNRKIKQFRYALKSRQSSEIPPSKVFDFQKSKPSINHISSRAQKEFELFSYEKIHDLPFDIKKDILEEAYRLYAVSDHVYISKSRDREICMYNSSEAIKWER